MPLARQSPGCGAVSSAGPPLLGADRRGEGFGRPKSMPVTKIHTEVLEPNAEKADESFHRRTGHFATRSRAHAYLPDIVIKLGEEVLRHDIGSRKGPLLSIHNADGRLPADLSPSG